MLSESTMKGREKFDSTNVTDVHSLNLPVGPINQSIGCLGKWESEQNSRADTALSVSPTRKTQLLASFVHSLAHLLSLPVSPVSLPWGLMFEGPQVPIQSSIALSPAPARKTQPLASLIHCSVCLSVQWSVGCKAELGISTEQRRRDSTE